MILSEIKIPPKLQEMLTEFRTSRYYKGTRETLKREQQRKNYDQLHMQYEYALLNNPLGKIWMHLYGDPEYAMEQILNVPPNPPYDAMDRIDFLCNLCLLMDLESQNATVGGKPTTKTFPRQALLDYVGKINDYVSAEWQDKTDDLWNDLMDEQPVIDFLTNNREDAPFNKQSFYRIFGILYNREVYTGKAIHLCRILENNDQTLVDRYRPSMSKGIDDDKICNIINRCVPKTYKRR